MKKNISNNEDIVVSVKDLSKSFKLPHNKQNSIKSALINLVKGGDRSFETQKVLKDISFDIKKGDFFGIVGRNGSGKSTLLKLLSGIYNPDKGSIKIEGSVVPFIELGVGFNPELTGKENVFLNGALLGFSHGDMVKMYDDIVEFAELGRFMDQKLKNYSSGMQVRLAFSIAIKAQGDILILDEVLAVGDEAFQRKCNQYFENIKKDSSKTVILVTHSMDSVKKYCNSAILIDNGSIVEIGDPDTVANQYTVDNLNSITNTVLKSKYGPGLSDLIPRFEIKNISNSILNHHDVYSFEIIYEITQDIPVTFGISIIDETLSSSSSIIDDYFHSQKQQIASTEKGVYRFKYEMPLRIFNNRNLHVTAGLFNVELGHSNANQIAYTTRERSASVIIRDNNNLDRGLLRQKGKWINEKQ